MTEDCRYWHRQSSVFFLPSMTSGAPDLGSSKREAALHRLLGTTSPRSVVDRTRPCEGRRPGSTPGEDIPLQYREPPGVIAGLIHMRSVERRTDDPGA